MVTKAELARIALLVVAIFAAGHALAAPPKPDPPGDSNSPDSDDPPKTLDEELTDPEPIGGIASGQVPDAEDHSYFQDMLPLLGSSGSWLRRGRLFAQADLVMLHRGIRGSNDIPLSNRVSLPGLTFGSSAMSTASTGFSYEPGMRITTGVFLGRDDKNRDHLLEFTFLGMLEWNASHAVSINAANLATEAFAPALDRLAFGFTAASEQSYRYFTNLNSFEVNARVQRRTGRDQLVLGPDGQWKRELTPGKIWGVSGGLRMIAIDEQFTFSANDGAAGRVRSTYDVKTHNDLFGVQIGGNLREQHDSWSFGVKGNAGALVNLADQVTDVNIFDSNFLAAPSTDRRAEAAQGQQLTLLVEMSLVGTYNLRPNLELRMSYDVIYLQGIATAPNQMTFDAAGPARLVSGSYALYDGASFGIIYFW